MGIIVGWERVWVVSMGMGEGVGVGGWMREQVSEVRKWGPWWVRV
jgi:hypothetical protein